MTGHQASVLGSNGRALGQIVFCAAPYRGAPTVKSFKPTKGAVGTLVKIRGSGFSGPVKVGFNGVDAVSVTLVSATEVHAIVPIGATTGSITVTTPYGTATSTILFVVS